MKPCDAASIFDLTTFNTKQGGQFKKKEMVRQLTGLWFFHSVSLPYCKVRLGHANCCACHAWNMWAWIYNLIPEDAHFPWKSAPWPPNMPDGKISCIAPPRQNSSLQTGFKIFHAGYGFGTVAKPLLFVRVLRTCTFRCACHAKRGFNGMFVPPSRIPKTFRACNVLHIWPRNLFRATTRCICSGIANAKDAPKRDFTSWFLHALRATAKCTLWTYPLPKVGALL